MDFMCNMVKTCKYYKNFKVGRCIGVFSKPKKKDNVHEEEKFCIEYWSSR